MSTWNVGQYHWEEHNANEWAKFRLNEIVNGIKVEGWELSDFDFKEITAARSIRKAKEYRSFEIVFECKFKHDEMTGKISFPDISNDCGDDPEDWDYELSFTGDSANKSPEQKKPIREQAAKDLIPVFRKAFAGWVKEFMDLPSELQKTP